MMLNASIVIYKNSFDEISRLVGLLRASGIVSHIFLIDNSPQALAYFQTLGCEYMHQTANIGYGAAHNIAFRQSMVQGATYHLVINPDIYFEPTELPKIRHFMNSNPTVGHVMPKVFYPNGQIQYLCKLLPTPFDLIFRRFVPAGWVKKRTEKFELRATGYNRLMDVPYLSGCFMFLRVEALMKVGLFDERFFLYPEDIDLTRRIHAHYRTVFFPDASVVHYHAQDSYRSFSMMAVHITNMIRYFNKWGWFIDKERKKINAQITANNK
ncbi:MAG: glycosyl transferase family 2 [Porphyromonadaceae bacterium CG2_30_38_12]|nr:MAG: glycosyl transferase family 2 [Porphyromonadaceae bacterium CG2_30_38_12]